MNLEDKTIAILVEKKYQDLEAWYPYYRLKEVGATVLFLAPDTHQRTGKYGYPLKPDRAVAVADVEDFDGVVIPGGFAPDYLRRDPDMVKFVRKMDEAGKLVAAICHGGWLLASAEIIEERQVTSFSGIKDDMIHAGADWQDKPVVQDGNLVTSRKPDDLPAFLRGILQFLSD